MSTAVRQPVRGVLLILLAWTYAWLTYAADAHAADLRTEVSARRVGVGQSFEVSVTAVQKEGEPEPQSPRLPVRGEVDVRGPSVGTQQRIMMRNFNFDSEQSVVARWSVTPRKVGKVVIGPATFQVGGKTLRGETIVVEVVQQPQRQQRTSPFGPRSIFGQDPFDNFDPFADDPFDDIFGRRRSPLQIPDVPQEYLAPEARDEVAFLHATLDKRKVVVGEPVRLTILAYGSRGNFREVSPNEPSLPDFLSYSVIESSHDEPAYQATLNGTRYIVRKLREYVLIPLKTGASTVGSMTAVLQGSRGAYPNRGSPLGFQLESPEVTLQVTDAPSQGRPDGFFPGDVGDYSLQVDVSPRNLSAGDYLEVLVRVSGEGQIPSKVQLPESNDFTWEGPTMSGGPEIIDGTLKGTRVLKYSVQVHTPGSLDLGEVRLPFFDHEKQTYRVARASLGKVDVAPAQSAGTAQGTKQTTDTPSTDSTGVAFSPRSSARPYPETNRLADGRSWPWAVFWGLPLGLLGIFGAQQGLNALLERRRASPKNQTERWIKQAKAEVKQGNEREALRLAERAMYEAILKSSGKSVKGSLREQIASELKSIDFDERLADNCQRILERLDQVRYDSSVGNVGDLIGEAEELTKRLAQSSRSRRKTRPPGSKEAA